MKKIIILLLLALLCLSVFACSPDQPIQEDLVGDPSDRLVDEDDQPADTQQLDQDANPVEEVGTPVTEIDQITGTWIATADLGNFVTTINPDGIFSVATSLEDLKIGSTDSWQLIIEDGQITASDFALCPGEVGTYLAVLYPDGTLKIITILDPCVTRIRKMDRSLPGRLKPYNLIYNRVD